MPDPNPADLPTMKSTAAAAAAAAATSSEKKGIGGKGRKKIPIAKIAGDRARMVTFSKRRNGLFKKAAELSTLCGARVAMLAFSQAGKPYVYGDVESLANSTIEEEKSTMTGLREWWRDLCIEGMGLEELEPLYDRLIMEKTMVERSSAQEWADSLMN